MTPEYQRVTAPGLPVWPPLLFDKHQKRAVVTARIATWKSGLNAGQACTLFAVILNLLMGVWFWQKSEVIDNPIGRGFLALFGFGIAATITKPLIPAAFRDFLARKVFAHRSTIWFTPQIIAFRSPMYENGIVVPRGWQGHPLQVRFDLALDPEAVALQAHPPGKAGHSPGLQSARVLRLVMTAFDPQRSVLRSTQGQLARAISLVSIDLQEAQQLTVILAAAAELTASASPPHIHSVTGSDCGLDIDANAT